MHKIQKWFKELLSSRSWIDSYLEDSVDVYDLEFRIRMLARKGLI